jgi:hypothetical protein
VSELASRAGEELQVVDQHHVDAVAVSVPAAWSAACLASASVIFASRKRPRVSLAVPGAGVLTDFEEYP